MQNFSKRFSILPVLLLMGLFFVLTSPIATAQDTEDLRENFQVETLLLAEKTHITAGEPFWLAVHQNIQPEWHVYWRNPGDSGLETRVNWIAPQGFDFSPLQFPVPKKIPFSGLLNFGYEGQVTYLLQVIPPKTIDTDTITITANLEWLVCKDICIPESVTRTITLPVKTTAAQKTSHAQLFDAARALWPRPAPFEQRLDMKDGLFHLVLENFADYVGSDIFDDLYFFPHSYGFVDYQSPQNYEWQGKNLVISLMPATDQIAENYGGVLSISENGTNYGFELLQDAPLFTPSPRQMEKQAQEAITLGLSMALLFAFLGGLILNLMPCVFPVLSIKALGLVQKADKAPISMRLHGLSYTAGVILSFLALAALLMVLKQGGAQIGWGFQLQSPIFVGFMVLLFFAFGLSLFGLFHLGGRFVGFGQKWAQKEGYGGSFATGVLATIVATPCTAPFMASAMGLALTLPTLQAMLIFAFLGLGLAFPYLLIASVPALARLLPRPGAWMERFKQFMAFPMWGAAIWLIWVLNLQTGAHGLLIILSSLLAMGLAVWLFSINSKWLGGAVLVLSLVLPLYLMTAQKPEAQTSQTNKTNTMAAQTFSQERLQDALAKNRPVFVNMTAAWCITCKANERIAIDQPQTMRAMLDANIVYLKGDWTNRDADISAYLESFGRSGVPLYVLYPRDGGAPVILPQLLTPSILMEHFTKI